MACEREGRGNRGRRERGRWARKERDGTGERGRRERESRIDTDACIELDADVDISVV
jgi:hypothetical protein